MGPPTVRAPALGVTVANTLTSLADKLPSTFLALVVVLSLPPALRAARRDGGTIVTTPGDLRP